MFSQLRWFLLAGFMISIRGYTAEDVSCSRIDFDQATLTYLSRCSYLQEFIVKPYSNSHIFVPFRDNAQHYLTNLWQGLTCGETVQSFSMNDQTELRMVYNLVFDTEASLEVRIVDLDRIDSDNKPTVVIRWKTEQATRGWGLFRERMDKIVKRAKVQIEANINAGSDVAIEYFTIFNYEVKTDECQQIDEFSTTTSTPTTTIALESTTFMSSTTTSSTHRTTASSIAPQTTDPMSTTDVTTIVTPTITDTTSTSSLSTSSVKTSSSTEYTTTSNSPRDETTSTLIETTTTSTTPAATHTTGLTEIDEITQEPVVAEKSTDWIWIALAATFAVLFCLATSSAIFIYAMNKQFQKFHPRLEKRGLKTPISEVKKHILMKRNHDSKSMRY
ncbi:uncharacterized protein LOC131680505 [Topomyia yanbarensis]|uniref:uncharacterized protein LOC131680505 n=1 Tax=Topomyia yanbarensis TaxID=2498891 RepID=UPI00273B348C|nr:uncharacterized protein LOC131680505 [Topomyia yanbarensis]